MSQTTTQQQQPKQIDLESLSLEQLSQFKQQEELRLQTITNQYANLRAASARFLAAKTALTTLSSQTNKKDNNNNTSEIMIPLTASLYVPGTIVNDEGRYLVELGTGFYATKTYDEAVSFLERKIRLVDGNGESVLEMIRNARRNVDAVVSAMQGKMLEIRARREGAQYRASREG